MDRYTIRKHGNWELCPAGSDEILRQSFAKWRLLAQTTRFLEGRDAVVDVYTSADEPVERMVFGSTSPLQTVAIPAEECISHG